MNNDENNNEQIENNEVVNNQNDNNTLVVNEKLESNTDVVNEQLKSNTDVVNNQPNSNVVTNLQNNYQQPNNSYQNCYNNNQYYNSQNNYNGQYYNNGQQYYNGYNNQQNMNYNSYQNGYNNQYYNGQNNYNGQYYNNGQQYYNGYNNQQNMNYNSYQNGYNNQYYNGQNNYNGQYYNNGYQYPYQQNYSNNNQYYYKQKSESHGLRNGLIITGVILALFIFIAVIFGVVLNKKSSRNVECKRALMIYMVGSDLETENGIATSDLDGLDYKKLEENGTKVILIAGGTKEWHNDYINGNETSIYELTEDGFVVVKKQKKQNMGNYKTLKNFLNYTYENYHADKYDLVFWNHGAGIFGNEFDELYGNDYLTTDEIKKAFEKSKFSSNNKLDAIVFRTCLNGTIEMADTIKDYADYMVASQEVAWGYNKDSVLKYFNDVKSDDNGYELGVKFIDGYKEYLSYLNDSYIYRTYSIIDLNQVAELESSVEDFFDNINLKNNYNKIAKVRSQIRQYGGDEKTYDSIDLYNLVDKLKYLSPDKGQKVLDNINKTVLYNSSTDSSSRGISIYFPYSAKKDEKNTILNFYYNFNNLNKYKTFINEFFSMQSSSSKTQKYDKNTVSYSENSLNNSADFVLELTDEQLEEYAKAEYVVFADHKDGTYVPIYRGKNVAQDNNLLKANIKGRQIEAHDANDDSSSPITLIEYDETDEYIKYITYVLLGTEEDFDVAEVTIILDKETNEITLGPAFVKSNADDDKALYNVLVDYDDYENIYFCSTGYDILDDDGNYNTDWEMNETIEYFYASFENLSFDLVDFNDGESEYYAVFYIYDVNNNVSFSNLIKIK